MHGHAAALAVLEVAQSRHEPPVFACAVLADGHEHLARCGVGVRVRSRVGVGGWGLGLGVKELLEGEYMVVVHGGRACERALAAAAAARRAAARWHGRGPWFTIRGRGRGRVRARARVKVRVSGQGEG